MGLLGSLILGKLGIPSGGFGGMLKSALPSGIGNALDNPFQSLMPHLQNTLTGNSGANTQLGSRGNDLPSAPTVGSADPAANAGPTVGPLQQAALDPLAGANNPGSSMKLPAPKMSGLPAGDREGYAYNYYLKKGISPHASAGIVGNMTQESAWRDDVLSGHRRGDGGASGFAAQWQGPRLRNLMAFARSRGESNPSLDTQLDFALEEMNPASPYADSISAANRDRILNAQSPREAALAFRNYFERPSAADHNNRVSYAERVAGRLDPNFVALGPQPNAHAAERGRDISLVSPTPVLSAGNNAARTNVLDDIAGQAPTGAQAQSTPFSSGSGAQVQLGSQDGVTAGGGAQDDSAELLAIAQQIAARSAQETAAKAQARKQRIMSQIDARRQLLG